jgi:hypothetical protein
MDEIIEEPIAAPAPEPEDGGMYLTGMAVYDLNRAAKWAKFLAIIGFIAAGIVAIVALFINTIFSAIPTYSAMPMAVGGFVTVIYLVIAAVVFVLNLYLYQFASRSIAGIAINDRATLESGIHRLQSFFKAYGIIMIVYLAFIVLALIASIGMSAMLRH